MTKQQAASAAYQWAWNTSNDKHTLTMVLIFCNDIFAIYGQHQNAADAYDPLVAMLEEKQREGRAGWAAPLEAVRKAMGLTGSTAQTVSADR